jgi:predicted ferric reductase
MKMASDLIKKVQYTRSVRLLWGACLTAVMALFLTGVIYVPFLFESQTLRYQFGLARNLLLTGQVMGTAAGFLLIIQIMLVCRSKYLDRVFSINRLLNLHRANAVIILFLAALHLALILSALGKEILALEIRQWPAYTGLLLFFMMTGIVFSGLFRGFIRIKYQFWIFFHRIFTPVTIILLFIHVYFVSDTFHYGNARVLIFCFFGACVLLYLILRFKRLRIFRYAYRVESVHMQAAGINTIELVPAGDRKITYAPGQFALLKIRSKSISGEEHPFTISSSPTRPLILQLTIKESGDWTEKVKETKAGDMAYIDGPFGIFGHLDLDSIDEVIMIAGGIGITPMLSILRYLHDKKSGRKITLLWSNRTQKEVVYPEEFRAMAEKMPNLTIKYLFTRENGNTGRLDRDGLEKLLSGCSREAVSLLCGPPPMMAQVRKDLLSIGFSGKAIIDERFSL